MNRIGRVLVMMGVLAVFSCAPQKSADRLVVALPADISGLDPLHSTSAIDYDIYRQIYPQLFWEQPDLRSFGPYLAKTWRWTGDHRRLLVLLRSGARWSDGSPVTTADVVATFETETDSASTWPFADSKRYIAGIQVLSDSTMLVEFSRAYPEQLKDLNEGFVLNRRFLQERGTQGTARRVISCGPYRLKSWQPQSRIVLQRDANFWEPAQGRIPQVVFEVVPDANTRISRLLASEVDLVDGVAPSQLDLIQDRREIRIEHFPDLMMGFIAWNNRDALFESSQVRRAMTLAIDRKAIIQSVYRGYARECKSPVHPAFWAYDSTISALPYDPEEARRLLENLGWNDRNRDGILEKSRKRFEFELLTIANNPIRRDIAVIVQNQLQKIGVRANVQMLDFSAFIERFRKGDFQALISAWKLGTKLDLRIFWHSRGTYNRVGYHNELVDSLLDQIDLLPAAQQQLVLWQRLQRLIYEDQPFTFLYIPEHLVAFRDRIGGYQMNFLSTFYNLKDWFLKPQLR